MPPGRLARLLDLLALGFAVAFLGLFVAQWAMFLLGGGSRDIGVDWVIYHDAAARWLAGDGFYLDHQVAGPYLVGHGDVLYPPPFLVLLVPFTVLPAPLWWLVPIAITAFVVVWHRPMPLAWLAIAICLWYPITGVKILHGNPGLWITAAIALGTRYWWPSVLVLLKPTLAPLAVIGIHRRAWWLGLAGLALISLLFLPMWPDFLSAIRNGQSELGPLYSLNELPLELIPIAAWIGGRRRWEDRREARPAGVDA